MSDAIQQGQTAPAANPVSGQALVFGHVFDGKGGSRMLTWDEIAGGLPAEGQIWLHFDRTHPDASKWVAEHLKLEHWQMDGLFDEDTRPRCSVGNANGVPGLLLNLRGINLNEGADPTDMVALRMWVSERVVVTLRRFNVRSVAAISDDLQRNNGPSGPGELVALITEKLMDLMGPTIGRYDAILDDAELGLVQTDEIRPPAELAEARRAVAALRRYLKPQAEALTELLNVQLPIFSQHDHAVIANARQDVLRFVEQLDEMREQSIFVYDEIKKRQDDRINRTMYRLTIITAVFLPLGFITGLLGINVGGMPGTDSSAAFWIVCCILAVIGIVVYGGFRALGYVGSSSTGK